MAIHATHLWAQLAEGLRGDIRKRGTGCGTQPRKRVRSIAAQALRQRARLLALHTDMSQSQRQQAAKLVPVGQGDVDYKSIFAAASTAGMKHFCIEQDNASQWGDSVAAARASLNGLTRILS